MVGKSLYDFDSRVSVQRVLWLKRVRRREDALYRQRMWICACRNDNLLSATRPKLDSGFRRRSRLGNGQFRHLDVTMER